MTIVMIVSWLVFGFVVGLLACAIFPGSQSMGFFETAALGIVGSFVGGLIGNLAWRTPLFGWHASGLIGSIVGALVILALVGLAQRRRMA